MKQQTNNKWEIISKILFIIIILAIVYIGIIQIQKNYYNKGISDGVNQTIQDIALSQVQTGNILITNGTAITTIPITQICQNLIDAQQGAKQ
jgi:TRAP-type C4-dicarboxylate transport system permease small subunit